MTFDQWTLVVVAVLTGSFALAGTWLASQSARKNEHDQWLRDQRRTSYSEILGAFDVLYLETGLPTVDETAVKDALFELAVKQGGVAIVAPLEVATLSDRLVDETWAMVQAARGVGPDAGNRFSHREKAKETANSFIEAVRNDLSVAKKKALTSQIRRGQSPGGVA